MKSANFYVSFWVYYVAKEQINGTQVGIIIES